jgi:hypothetical protein
MGLTPQYHSEVYIHGFIGRLGLMKILSAWYFVLIFFWFIVILGMVIIKKLSKFRLKKDIPFVLNHLGLFIVLVSALFGNGDVKRYKLTASIGNPEWRSFDSRQNMVKLPFKIELNSFTIEEYPPKLLLLDNETVKALPEKNSVNLLVDENCKEGYLLDWHITIEKYIENGATDEEFVNYIEYQSTGATCALYVKAENRKTAQQHEGWVSCGNFMFPGKTLLLDERTSLIMPPREPRRFLSDVKVYTASNHEYSGIIEVNKPMKIDGWKIYQVGYNQSMGKWSDTSVFEIVRDPWLPVVYTGIWMMIAGALCLFIIVPKQKEVTE